MARPILVMRNRSTSNTQGAVFKLINGNLRKVGSDFGARESTAATSTISVNKVGHFQNDLYAILGDVIFKYDTFASGDWGAFYDLAAPDAADLARIGPFPVIKNNETQMLFMYSVGANSIRGVFVDDSGIVSETASITTNAFADYGNTFKNFDSPTMFNNKLVWWQSNISGGQNSVVEIFDPEAETLTEALVGTSTAIQPSLDFVVFQSRLYTMGFTTFPNPAALIRVEGSNINNLFDIVSQDTGGGANARNCLFTDGDDIYSIHLSNPGAGIGWRLSRMQPTGVILPELTNTVLPAAARPGSTPATDGRWWCYIDNEDDEIFLFWANGDSEGVSVSQYRWRGPTQELEFLEATADTFSFAMCHDKGGGGHRVWSGSGEINAKLKSSLAQGTNIVLEYVVHGSGQSGIALEGLFDKNGEHPKTQMTLTAPSSPGFLNGAFVSGLVADNTTRHLVTWNAASDGIVPGDVPNVVFRTFL